MPPSSPWAPLHRNANVPGGTRRPATQTMEPTQMEPLLAIAIFTGGIGTGLLIAAFFLCGTKAPNTEQRTP